MPSERRARLQSLAIVQMKSHRNKEGANSTDLHSQFREIRGGGHHLLVFAIPLAFCRKYCDAFAFTAVSFGICLLNAPILYIPARDCYRNSKSFANWIFVKIHRGLSKTFEYPYNKKSNKSRVCLAVREPYPPYDTLKLSHGHPHK